VIQHAPQYLPSEGLFEEVVIKDAVSVSSNDGESFNLIEKVNHLVVLLLCSKLDISVPFELSPFL